MLIIPLEYLGTRRSKIQSKSLKKVSVSYQLVNKIFETKIFKLGRVHFRGYFEQNIMHKSKWKVRKKILGDITPWRPSRAGYHPRSSRATWQQRPSQATWQQGPYRATWQQKFRHRPQNWNCTSGGKGRSPWGSLCTEKKNLKLKLKHLHTLI